MTNLKSARIALNMTQEELAKLFGVTPTTLARWERRDSNPDAPGMLILALEALEGRQKMKMLREPDFLSRKEKTKRSIRDTLNHARQRVRHVRSKAETVR